MRYLGIDQGLANIGLVIIDDENKKVIHKEVFKTNSKKTLPERINLIYERIQKLITQYNVDVMATENIFAPVAKTSKRMLNINMITGIINLLAHQNNIRLINISPKQIKKYITGSGKAEKELVQSNIEKILNETFKEEHDSDAASIAWTAIKIA